MVPVGLTDAGGALSGVLEYNTDLFEAVVESVASAVEELEAGETTDPDFVMPKKRGRPPKKRVPVVIDEEDLEIEQDLEDEVTSTIKDWEGIFKEIANSEDHELLRRSGWTAAEMARVAADTRDVVPVSLDPEVGEDEFNDDPRNPSRSANTTKWVTVMFLKASRQLVQRTLLTRCLRSAPKLSVITSTTIGSRSYSPVAKLQRVHLVVDRVPVRLPTHQVLYSRLQTLMRRVMKKKKRRRRRRCKRLKRKKIWSTTTWKTTMKGLVMKATTTRSERQCIVGSFGSSISEDWRFRLSFIGEKVYWISW